MAGINRTTGKATDLITFSRASGGTSLRKISYGSELVTNGGFDTDTSGWTALNGTATVSSGVVEFEQTTVSGLFFSDDITVEAGKVYEFSFFAKRGTMTVTKLSVRNQTAGADIISATPYVVGTSELERVSVVFVAPAGCTAVRVYTFRDSGGAIGTAFVDNISVKEVLFDQPDGTLTLFNHPTNIPRIDYNADGTVKGLLIEEQRTNLFTYSEDFTNASWAASGSTIGNSVSAPDGNTTANSLEEDSSTGLHRLSTTVSLYSDVRTLSFFAKANGRTHINLVATGSVAENFISATFDLSGVGSVTQTDVGTTSGTIVATSIERFGDYYRCCISGSANSIASIQVVLSDSATPTNDTFGRPSYTGDGTSGIYIWGAQLEAGSFATSYIPTSGATATRAADIASISVDNFGYRQDAGTVVVEFEVPADHGTSPAIAGLGSDSYSGSNSSKIYMSSSTARHLRVFSDAGVSLFEIDAGTTPIGQVVKQAFAIKSGNHAAVIDGGTVATSSDANALPNPTRLYVDPPSGHIKSIAYYPRRLSNAQLVQLTA